MEVPKIVYVHMVDHDIHQWSDKKDFIDYQEYIHSTEFKSIIKLNEELTAENARLLERIDELEKEIDIAENAAYWASKKDKNY